MHKVILRTFVAVIIIGIFYWIYYNQYLAPYYLRYPEADKYPVPKDKVYIFPDLHGPEKKSRITIPSSTSYKRYSKGSRSRMAVLLTDDNSFWLELAHGLKSMGIPFLITKDYREALKHKMVFIYPTSNGLSAKEKKAIADFPKKGGTLLVQGYIPFPLTTIFGIKSTKTFGQNKPSHLIFTTMPSTESLTEEEHKKINIGDGKQRSLASYSYTGSVEKPLALYENQEAAWIQKTYLKGHAYALGLDLGRLISIGYSGRQWEEYTIANHYVNHYEPHIDTILEVIKNIYIQQQNNAVTLSAVPYGKSLALMISFDNDSAEAVSTMGNFLSVLLKYYIKGTFFILTKYISDSDDFAFFTSENLPLIDKLVKAGMEVGSEGVSHSFHFNQFSLGTGKEKYPAYQPYTMQTREKRTPSIMGLIPATITYNGSIFGELRVSRFLLGHFFPQIKLESFRPGYLKYPRELPQALNATDFHYNSATTVGDALTHLPFQLNFNRGRSSLVSAELPVFEFPITLEDQSWQLNERLPDALELARKISVFGGPFLILIHPSSGQEKIEFLDQFITQVQKKIPTWIGTLGEYGAWWAARNEVGVDVSTLQKKLLITLSVPKAIDGLTLIIPKKYRFKSSQPTSLKIKQDKDELIIQSRISGQIKLILFLKN